MGKMKIGLIDLDRSKFPNIPLMKISAYHKAKGDEVEWYDPLFSGWLDRVYIAKVFDWTPDYEYEIRAKEIIKGGIGYGINNDNKLPEEIEHAYPDYEIYGIKDEAYGFLTRGCPRQCAFCNVSQHQGKTAIKTADLNEFWNGQKKIVLLDPNILACDRWKELMQQLIDSRAKVDFSQGLDIRMMTDEKAEMLNQIKIDVIHFAWDNYEEATYKKLKEYRTKLKFTKRKLAVYVLVNFKTTFEQDLDRVNRLRSLEYEPYVMIYDRKTAPKNTRQLARWTNNKIIWGVCGTFEDYINYGK